MKKDGIRKVFTVEEILSIFKEVLDFDEINSSDNFFDLGGDSFDAIKLISKLGNSIRIVEVFENPTAEKLAKYIESNQKNKKVDLVRISKKINSESEVAMIGVPYGGGDPTVFKNMFKDNKDINVYGVDFGDAKVENSIEFEELLNKVVKKIEGVKSKMLVIYGHCAGASTATCLAYILREKGFLVKLVIAASNPVIDTNKAISDAKETSDNQWSLYLRSLGAFSGLNNDEVKGMMSRGRRDHYLSVEGYKKLSKNPVKNVNALLILGDKDISTPNLEEVVQKWSNYTKVDRTEILKGAGHYFIRTNYMEVSKIILDFIEC